MKRTQSARIAVAAAVIVLTMSLLGTAPSSAAFAQSETPMPLATTEASSTTEATATPAPAPAVTATEAATTTQTDQSEKPAKPAKTEAIVWTPASGNLTVAGGNIVTVRVANTNVNWDLTTAKFVRLVGGVIQPEQAATATAVGNNQTVDLAANVGDSTATPSGSIIIFKINEVGNATASESPQFTLQRSSKLSLPVIQRDSGVSTIPTSISTVGGNSCDASINKKGGPLGPFVTYNAVGTTNDMWFYAFNAVPAASIVVSLTNYSVTGQLQVYAEQNSNCGSLTGLLGFGANPNPVVSLSNVPAGIIYFRVASTSTTPTPFNIRWAYQGSGSGGTTGAVEPGAAPCTANVISKDTIYSTNIRNKYNYFALNIDAPTQIRVRINGLAVGNAQIQVRSPVGTTSNGCDPINSTTRLDPFGVVPSGGGNVLMTVGVGVSGKYFIRVSLPDGVGAAAQPYTVQWQYIAGSDTAQPIFTTNPTQPLNPPYNGDISGNVVEGGVFTFFWSGMNAIIGGYDTLQLRINAKSDLLGCPNNTYPSDPTKTVPEGYGNNFKNLPGSPAKGQISIKFNKSGGYAVAFRAMRSGTQVYFDEKPMRIGCGFATLNTPSILAAAGEKSVDSPTAGPAVELMTGYRLSEQDTPAPDGVEPQP